MSLMKPVSYHHSFPSLAYPSPNLASPPFLFPLPFPLPLSSSSSLTFSPSPSATRPIIRSERNTRTGASPGTCTAAAGAAAGTVTAAEQEEEAAALGELVPGADVVRRFYDGINRHDLESAEVLIAEDCVYEDLVFPKPFTGRKAIMEFFKKFNDSISTDLQFVIDDISDDDSTAVGVTWHLEWSGRPFPFSKGCSFYRLAVVNGSRQIIYARDSVEPALKPGDLALVAIRGVTWLLRQFPQLADRL